MNCESLPPSSRSTASGCWKMTKPKPRWLSRGAESDPAAPPSRGFCSHALFTSKNWLNIARRSSCPNSWGNPPTKILWSCCDCARGRCGARSAALGCQPEPAVEQPPRLPPLSVPGTNATSPEARRSPGPVLPTLRTKGLELGLAFELAGVALRAWRSALASDKGLSEPRGVAHLAPRAAPSGHGVGPALVLAALTEPFSGSGLLGASELFTPGGSSNAPAGSRGRARHG
mmetsp:Transcript_92561/g.257830  ORF Transcript_92561/g.257830 Transcript_92561/m.257830 type:complete len:230 (-) Transcript_92561:122-811(-)